MSIDGSGPCHPCTRDEEDCDWYRDEWRRLARDNEAIGAQLARLTLTEEDREALRVVMGNPCPMCGAVTVDPTLRCLLAMDTLAANLALVGFGFEAFDLGYLESLNPRPGWYPGCGRSAKKGG